MALSTAFNNHQPPEYKIRPTGLNDFKWAYDLFKRVNLDTVTELAGDWPEPWQTKFFREGFYKTPPFIIETAEGERVGMFAFDISAHKIRIKHLHIDESHQRQGLGKYAVEAGLKLAHEQRKVLDLEVLENNHNAIKFYIKNGFLTAGDVLEDGWVREIPMRHKDTFQYGPKIAPGPEL